MRSFLTAGVFALLCAEAFGAQTSNYHNPAFGFSINLPKGMRICTRPAITTDHGVTIPLTPDESCFRDITGPSIEVYAASNAAFAARTTEELALKECDSWRPKGHLEPATDALSIPGKNTFLCRHDGDVGNVEIDLETLTPTTDPIPVTWTHFAVSLYTTSDRLAKDTETLKTVLSRIRFDKRPR